jgi:hypothetical protein
MFLPCWCLIFIFVSGLTLLLITSEACLGQVPSFHKDSLSILSIHTDSVFETTKKLVDTGFKSFKSSWQSKKNQFLRNKDSAGPGLTGIKIKNPLIQDSGVKRQLINPYKNLFKFSSPFFHFDGGYLAYNYNYHSSTDTPYAEKNISQNMLNASVNFSIEKYLPFVANFYVTRSNSQFFRNITDVQIIFNAAAFHSQIANSMKHMYGSMGDSLKNPALENAYALKIKQLLDLRNWLKNPFQLQRLIQANETVNIPQKSYNPSLSDSVNARRIDSLQAIARTFIKTYNEEKSNIDKLEHEQDSLGRAYRSLKSLIGRYKSMLSGGVQNSSVMANMEDSLRGYGIKGSSMPPEFNWLMGVRNFAMGKTPVNYTELTAKNISVTGVNFEYNSWYYLALCAGLIDYRFNDPVVNRANKVKQYLYMARIGLGKVENNHFILSFYGGRKQLFTTADSSGSQASIPVTGISAEAQLKLNPYSYLVAEVAESFSPDFHFSPAKQNSGFNFSDNTNKAISLRAYGYIPFTGTKLEGMYKYTGSNFQSFSFFQTNASLRTWYIKADQFLWKRKLRLTASVRTNDFTNPYIIQNYNSNTIFSSFSASLRSRGFPSITVGYMPMSQLTAVGSEIVENKFQTLTANVNHYYRVGSIRASSTGVLSKFYNNGSDTSFVFYNATNILLQQSFFFKDFTGSLNFSRSASARYNLNVAGEEINFPFSKRGSVGIGFKLNNYNKTENKVGQVFNLNYQIGGMDYISMSIERGYLPGSAGVLVHNDFGNIQFVKRFR